METVGEGKSRWRLWNGHTRPSGFLQLSRSMPESWKGGEGMARTPAALGAFGGRPGQAWSFSPLFSSQVCHPDQSHLALMEGGWETRRPALAAVRQHGQWPVPAREEQSVHQSPRICEFSLGHASPCGPLSAPSPPCAWILHPVVRVLNVSSSKKPFCCSESVCGSCPTP